MSSYNKTCEKKSDLDLKKPTFWQPWFEKVESPKQSMQKQATKWKRDRRSRLPEYTRKSDPKIIEAFGSDSNSEINNSIDIVDISSHLHQNGHQTEYSLKSVNRIASNGNLITADTPLDMSIRQRGLPPSYAQTINSPSYRSHSRPPIFPNGETTVREEIRSGMSMCDPIIDEHFRRSLGNDYHTIFHNNNVSKEQVPQRSPPTPPTPTSSVIELMDNAGVSVDEHFAKALGDTWFRLNSKDSETKSNASKNNLVSI